MSFRKQLETISTAILVVILVFAFILFALSLLVVAFDSALWIEFAYPVGVASAWVILFDMIIFGVRSFRQRELVDPRLARRTAKERRSLNEAAQLKKPAFETRLNVFLDKLEPQNDIEFLTSQSEYWEADDLQIELRPPKPIGYLRILLRRIARYVTGNGKQERQT